MAWAMSGALAFFVWKSLDHGVCNLYLVNDVCRLAGTRTPGYCLFQRRSPASIFERRCMLVAQLLQCTLAEHTRNFAVLLDPLREVGRRERYTLLFGLEKKVGQDNDGPI